MKVEYLLFIVLSAFLHAFYNFLMRRSGGSRVFLTGMFVAAGSAAAIITFVTGGYRDIPWHLVPFVYGASFFYILYQVSVSKAYEKGDISRYYPLTVLSPVFIPVWAALFISERISFLTGCGIFITIIGAVLVKLDHISLAELKKMFRFSKDYKGARYALAASFFYSFGAVFDKSKIAFFPLQGYLAILLISMALNGMIYLRFIEKERMLPYFKKGAAPPTACTAWPFSHVKDVFSNLCIFCKRFQDINKKHLRAVMFGGCVVFLSFFTFRIALKAVPVSIAVPIRQVAIVFAILSGVLLLREKPRLNNLIGSAIIILGIVLVNFGY